MSTFSKNYYSPKDSDTFISVMWDSGYKNIQFIYEGKIIKVINNPRVLIKGIQFEIENLGKVDVKFTTVGPKMLEVKVNRKRFKTVNNLHLGYDFRGVVMVFGALAVLAALGALIILGLAEFNLGIPIIAAVFVFDLVIITIYGLTAYLLSKQKAWAYFLGTSVYLLTTAFTAFSGSIQFSGVLAWLFLLIRFGILIYLVFQVGHIIREMRSAKDDTAEIELLDN